MNNEEMNNNFNGNESVEQPVQPVQPIEEPIQPTEPVQPIEEQSQPVEPVQEQPKFEEPIQEQPAVEPVAEPAIEAAIEESVVQPANEETVSFSSEVSGEPQVERQEIVQEPIPVDTKEFKEAQATGKKNSKAVKYILIILIALIILGVGLFVFLKFFDKESYTKSVDTMQKSVENLSQKFENSGTVTAKAELSVKDLITFNIGAALEYENTGNAYKIHGHVDKIEGLLDEIDIYAQLDEEKLEAYLPTSLLEQIDDSIAESIGNVKWVKLGAKLSELGIEDFEGMMKEVKAELSKGNEDFDISKILIEENFKYVGKSGGLKKYTLKVNEDYINKVGDSIEKDVADLDELDSLEDFEFNIDFYVDSNNCLQKISIDLKEAFEKQMPGYKIEKFELSIEFSKFNKTKVEVPADVKKNAKDITKELTGGATVSVPTGAFSITIDDKYNLDTKGVVATGRIASGEINLNDVVKFTNPKGVNKIATVTCIEQFRKSLDHAEAGDNVGICLSGITIDDIEIGTVITK